MTVLAWGERVNQTVKNERLKLIANFCNIVSSAIIATGTLGPIQTLTYSKAFIDTDPALVGVGCLICLLVVGAYI